VSGYPARLLAAAYPEALCSESVSLPSSLLRPHLPVPLPLLTFAFTLAQQSVPLGPPTAGQGTFPTLPSRIFHWMPRPLPRRLQRCSFPFLPFGLRPFPELTTGRRLALFRAATSARGRISGLQTFPYLKASSFACHPGRSHRCVISFAALVLTLGRGLPSPLFRVAKRVHISSIACSSYSLLPQGSRGVFSEQYMGRYLPIHRIC
jgi:hypothetical protein